MPTRYKLTIGSALFVAMLLAGYGGSRVLGGVPVQETETSRSGLRSYDFGHVRAGEDVHHIFALDNPGPEALTIEGVQSTCGCTVAGVDSKVIPSRGTVDMAVTLETEGKNGRLRECDKITYFCV